MGNNKLSQQTIDTILQLLLLFGILFWCFEIILPFLMPSLWGLIIAVALNPIQQFFEKKLKLKPVLAAVIITILMLSLLLVPSIVFFTSVTQTILDWKTQFETKTFVFPEPPEFLGKIPIIGNKILELTAKLNNNIKEFVVQYQEQILDISKKVLGIMIGTTLSVLQAILSIILAGVFLAIGDRKNASENLFTRLVGKDGVNYVILAVQTIRNVVKGILGVAFIQSLLAGVGFYLAEIPHAPIWILLCLIMSIVQVGPGIIILGTIVYLFQHDSIMTASLWAIYFFGVGLSDNILKPILLGKGAPVPMLVIFLGVVGGFMLSGFIGLFTGAIILSIGYKLFRFWLDHKEEPEIEPTV